MQRSQLRELPASGGSTRVDDAHGKDTNDTESSYLMERSLATRAIGLLGFEISPVASARGSGLATEKAAYRTTFHRPRKRPVTLVS